VNRIARERAIVVFVATAIAVVVALTIRPTSPDNPARLAVLDDIVAGRSVGYTPFSIGYVAFAGFLIRWFGVQAVVWAQAGLYVLTVLLSFETLGALDLDRRAAAAGALAVAVYPTITFTITRVLDTGTSCFFMSAFAWLVVRLRKDGLSNTNMLIGGTLLGIMPLIRPNAVTLVPLVLWAALRGQRLTVVRLVRLAGAAALAVGIAAAVVVPLKGRFVIFDRYYGAYNFAAGANEHALDRTIGTTVDYGGSLALAMHERGWSYYFLDRTDPVVAAQYTHIAWQFIHDHPFRYVTLEALKFVNLFRPDYANVQHSFVPPAMARTVHTLIAALVVVWAALCWRCRHLRNLSDGLIIVPMLALYFAPFVATVTLPRYRVPTDALLIMDSVVCLSLLWARRGELRLAGRVQERLHSCVSQ
jgi:hypothetical protein